MKNRTRRFISLIVLLSFFIQLFSPAIMSVQAVPNQKAQIDKAVADYKEVYDEIMNIEPIELGKVSKWALNRINDIKNLFSNPPWKKESEKEKKARKEKEKLERYVTKIKKANKDIKKIQADAKKTMSLLKSGKFQEAAKTDPSKVYNSLDKNATALGIYQKALKGAGKTLLDASSTLSKAATVIGAVSILCAAITAGFPPAAPFTGPIAAITGKVTSALGISASILTAAGNTLVEAADKAITSDKEFLTVAGKEATKAAASQAINRLAGRAIGNFAGDYAKSVVDNEQTQEVVKILVKKSVGDAAAPAKTAAKDLTGQAIDKVPNDIVQKTQDTANQIKLPNAKAAPSFNGW
jgi:hypothetical protein